MFQMIERFVFQRNKPLVVGRRDWRKTRSEAGHKLEGEESGGRMQAAGVAFGQHTLGRSHRTGV